MAFVRTVLFYAAFFAGSTLIVLFGLVATIFDSGELKRTVARWARWHRGCARVLIGLRVTIEGTVPTGPVLVAAKHQAPYDAIDMLMLLRDPIVVMKQDLVDIPGWGRLASRYGIIPIDRKGGAGTLRAMIAAAKAAVASGRPVAIFPEGTRVAPGETPPLQSGFAGLYKTLGLPVVPLATDVGRVWPRSFVKHGGKVRFRFGDPIPPGLKRGEVEARVHAAINVFEQS